MCINPWWYPNDLWSCRKKFALPDILRHTQRFRLIVKVFSMTCHTIASDSWLWQRGISLSGFPKKIMITFLITGYHKIQSNCLPQNTEQGIKGAANKDKLEERSCNILAIDSIVWNLKCALVISCVWGITIGH